MDRGEWRKICGAAKVLQELYSHEEKEEDLPWQRYDEVRTG
jgi:hypothetical protein